VRRTVAAAGSSAFFLIAPGMLAGVIPWWLTGWEMRWSSVPYAAPLRALGAVLIAVGTGVLVSAFVRFVREGAGTPAPVAPAAHLVVGGLYRYVRNPIYLALIAVILGQALLLGQPVLVPYAALVLAAVASFVRWREEPVLVDRFGARYEEYRRAVPGWRPRLRPWRPEADPSS
jgi:protein-S-isoprenylcysteine O-methyltransferase Ste14